MAETVTQAILFLTLLFGVATILPKALFMHRQGRRGRALMYLFMAAVCGFFMVLSVVYAIDSFNIWKASD